MFVLFDLDGTLMETRPGLLHSIRDTVKEMKLPEVPDHELETMIGPPIRDGFRRVFGLDDEKSDQARQIFRTVYPRDHLFEASVFPGIRELLADLRARGIPLGIATSKPEWYLMPLLERFDLVSRFDFISGAKPGRESKREVLSDALKGIGCDQPRNAVLVGDTIYDKTGAEAVGAGFIPVAWGCGYTAGSGEPDLCLTVEALRQKLLMKGTCSE